MNARLTYAIRYVDDRDAAVAFHRDQLGLVLKIRRFLDSEGAECSIGGG